MDWNSVKLNDLAEAFQQAEVSHPPRPLSEFFGKFSAPKNTNKAVSRIKCNLWHYRTNYGIVMGSCTGLCLVRNPLGSISLLMLAAGALVFNDTIASRASASIVSGIKSINPQLAAKIRSTPGGHDGQSVPPGRKPVAKIAGQDRNALGYGLLGVGSVAAWLTSAVGTLLLGAGLGSACILAHAILRSPNLKARITSARRRFDEIGGDLARDYGL